MAEQYTPSDKQIRDEWISAMTTEDPDNYWDAITDEEARARWSRWLAAHDARVKRDAAREALDRAEHRIARLEAQTSIRGRAVVMYRERAREAEAERDEWRQTALDERGAALDALEQVKVRDARVAEEKHLRMKATAAATKAEARIKAVRDVLDRHAHYGLVEVDDIRRALDG